LRKSNNTDFNFIDTIGHFDTYQLLFPKKLESMVIIALFVRQKQGKYPDGLFGEEDIHALFSTYGGTDVGKGKPYQRSINKEKLRKLLKFFLNYDEEKRMYYFQSYGTAICELMEKTLEGLIKPTDIGRICQNLKRELITAQDDEDELIQWFSISLDAYKNNLSQQTDFLHKQIDNAVSKLRKDVLSEDKNPVELLKTVRDDLTEVQEKNRELRIAFQDVDGITNDLNRIDTENIEIIDYVDKTNKFFSRINSKLRSTDNRLDRIQPKIRQLFATLSRPEWSAKTEKFIHFLLKNSTLKKVKNNREIVFPKEIFSFKKHIDTPRLITFKRDESLFPTPTKPRRKYGVNPEIQKQNKQELQQEIDELKRIEVWVSQLLAELDKDGQMNASEAFFRVLKIDQDFTIASEVYFDLIEKVQQQKKFEVNVLPQESVMGEQTKSILWKVMIKRK